MDVQMLGGLGWRELVLIAAIVLLLVQTILLAGPRRTRATEGRGRGVGASGSRDYIDRLLGPARNEPGEAPRTGVRGGSVNREGRR